MDEYRDPSWCSSLTWSRSASALTRTRREVAGIAAALERAAAGAAPLDDKIGRIGAAMRQLAERTGGLSHAATATRGR